MELGVSAVVPQGRNLKGGRSRVAAVGVFVEVFKVFSLDSSAAFVGADHQRRGRGGDLQGFLPGQGGGSTALCEAEMRSVGLVATFSDVMQLLDVLALFSLANMDIISISSFSGRHSPSCSCDSYGGF